MEKVVSFFKSFMTIFYFNFLSSGKSFLDPSNLKEFEYNLNKFEI
jgi:hypothetical protein